MKRLLYRVVIFVLLYIDFAIAGPFAFVPGGMDGLTLADGSVGYMYWIKTFRASQSGIYKSSIILAEPPFQIEYQSDYDIVVYSTYRYPATSLYPADFVRGGIRILSPSKSKESRRVDTGEWGNSFVVAYPEKKLYVLLRDGHLVVYDLDTLSKGKEYFIEGEAGRLYYNKKRRAIYVTTQDKGATFVIDTSTSLAYPWLTFPSWIVDVAFERHGKMGFFLAANRTLYIVDLDSSRIVGTVDFSARPAVSLAASPTRNEIYVALGSYKGQLIGEYFVLEKGEIVVLDSGSGAILRRFDAQSSVDRMNTSLNYPDTIFIIGDSLQIFYALDALNGAIVVPVDLLSSTQSPTRVFEQPEWQGKFVLDAPEEISAANRLFNWAEDKYPELFSAPFRPLSGSIDGYFSRCYSGSNTCLGTKDGNVHYLPPGAGKDGILNLGPVSDFLPKADAAGY